MLDGNPMEQKMQSHHETDAFITGAIGGEYDLGSVGRIDRGGGTAAGTWIVSTVRGRFLLRRRGNRTSDEATVAVDHGLRRHLVANGVPTAAPVGRKTGATWFARAVRVWDL